MRLRVRELVGLGLCRRASVRRPHAASSRSRPRARSGFTIMEMAIVIFFIVVIFFTVGYAFVNTSRTSVSLERRADVTLSLQDGVDRMIDQLRVAEAVLVADADTVVVLVEGARVTFQFNSANRTLERDGVTLGRNIESLSFEYLDAGGSPAASLDSIRRIDVHVQAKLGEEDWELATSVNLRKLHG